MDLLSLIRILLRRWQVVVPVLVLSVAGAYLVHSQVPPEYEASGWVLLETPALDATDRDPLVDVVALGDELADDPDADLPSGARFVVQRGEEGGRYAVSVAAGTAQAAEQTATRVIEYISDRAQQLQEEAGVEDAARQEVRLVTPSIVPEQEADGSFTAVAGMELRDPTALVENPYGANAGTGRILEVAVNGDSGRQRFLERADGNVGYAVSQASRDSAALLQVKTFGSDAEEVLGAFDTVRQILNDDLLERQARAGVPESRRVTVETFDPPLRVLDVGPPLDRATAAVLLLGGLAAIGLGVAADSMLARRKDRDASTTGLLMTRTSGPADRGRSRGDDARTGGSSSADHTAPPSGRRQPTT